jgi:2-polyprenyl-3-methyl-5-hydroxy-6-metoxy-1,4-benzoquinol methylase
MSRVEPASAARAAREVEHWRQIADRAEDYWGWTTPAGRLRAERRVAWLVERGAIGPGASCLEVGCGTGFFTAALAQTGARIDAVDISPELLDRARQRLGSGRVTFILADAHTGEHLGGPYDAVVGISVLHHLDLSLALPTLVGVLRPGGRFVFSEPNMRNPQIWLQKRVGWLKRLAGDSPDETAFYAGQIVALLEGQGLTDVEARPFDWLHPATPKRLIRPVAELGRWLEQTPGVRRFAGSLAISARKP